MRVPNFTGSGKVSFEERKIPVPGDNQLLIQAKSNLLCGSDRKQFYSKSDLCIENNDDDIDEVVEKIILRINKV